MGDLFWFRLELDGSAKVISCVKVIAAGTSEGGVFYVPARNAESAAKLAYNAHNAALLRARRAQYAKEGRCRCGRPQPERAANDPRLGEKRCDVCLKKQSEHNKRRALREKGVDIPKPDRRTAIAARRVEEADILRLSVLKEVDEVWRAKGAVGLRIWLRKELARLSKGRAA
jgi:hypothetical protein